MDGLWVRSHEVTKVPGGPESSTLAFRTCCSLMSSVPLALIRNRGIHLIEDGHLEALGNLCPMVHMGPAWRSTPKLLETRSQKQLSSEVSSRTPTVGPGTATGACWGHHAEPHMARFSKSLGPAGKTGWRRTAPERHTEPSPCSLCSLWRPCRVAGSSRGAS